MPIFRRRFRRSYRRLLSKLRPRTRPPLFTATCRRGEGVNTMENDPLPSFVLKPLITATRAIRQSWPSYTLALIHPGEGLTPETYQGELT